MRDRALTHLHFPGFPWAWNFYFNLWNTQKEYTFLWSFLCYLSPRWPLVVARGVWTYLPCTNTAHLRFSAHPHSCLCVLIKCPLGLKKWRRSLLSMLGHLRGERNVINSHAGQQDAWLSSWDKVEWSWCLLWTRRLLTVPSWQNKRTEVVEDGRATCHLYMALGVELWSPCL